MHNLNRHEVSRLIPSHPSDYMNNFEDSLSSDSSNPTIKMAHHPKTRATHSLHHPCPPPLPPRPPKKTSKHAKHPTKAKPTAKESGKGRAVSDYLILGESYFRSAKVREVTRRFVEEQRREAPRVMRVQRLQRKE
jgi:hypothetical protein